MASKIPRRYMISTPEDIEKELSNTSAATECFVDGKFSKLLQEYMVDYSLTVGSSPLLLTDEPYLKSEKD